MIAPERIWATWKEDFGAVQIGTWADTIRFEPAGNEYVLKSATDARLAEAEAMAVKHGALHGRDYGWGHFVEPACYARQNAYRIAHGVQSAPFAALTDRDGLQAYAVALSALDGMIVAAEDRVAA